MKEGKTDEEGNATEVYQVPSTYANMGALQTNFYTTVFDETGRPVTRAISMDIFTQDVFYGVKRDVLLLFTQSAGKISTGIVNKDGNPSILLPG